MCDCWLSSLILLLNWMVAYKCDPRAPPTNDRPAKLINMLKGSVRAFSSSIKQSHIYGEASPMLTHLPLNSIHSEMKNFWPSLGLHIYTLLWVLWLSLPTSESSPNPWHCMVECTALWAREGLCHTTDPPFQSSFTYTQDQERVRSCCVVSLSLPSLTCKKSREMKVTYSPYSPVPKLGPGEVGSHIQIQIFDGAGIY